MSKSFGHRKFTRRQALIIGGAAGAAVVAALSGSYQIGQMLNQTLTFTPSRITRENQLLGTTDWEISSPFTGFIQGYAGQVSALPGDTVSLYISLMQPTDYDIDVYRIGWYNGAGGRLVYSKHDIAGMIQGYWTYTEGLVGASSYLVDPKTGSIDANWEVSYELPIGSDWVSGVYLIKLTAANQAQSYIPLVVRDPQNSADILFSIPVNTYQAYNLWGGGSLYGFVKGGAFGETANAGKATKVSFNRPYDRSAGSGDFLSWDIHIVRWLEREGFDVSYATNVDVATDPTLLLSHRIHTSGAHDEYWTMSMRDGMETARNNGVSLAFFGANACYWQARLEPDHAGQENRTLVCYKVGSGSHRTNHYGAKNTLAQDPGYALQPETVTALWRDPAIDRPENELLGLMYKNYFVTTKYHWPDWVASTGPLDSLMVGTGLQPGQHIKGGLLGYEYDAVWENEHTPSNLVVLASSPVVNVSNSHDIANTAYYRAASGAIVFDAGSIWWCWGLDESVPPAATQPNHLRGSAPIRNLSRNIIRAMLAASPVKTMADLLPF
jgi:hypothetical protein